MRPLPAQPYASPLALSEGEDRQAALQAITAFLFADRQERDQKQRLEMAQSLMNRYELEHLSLPALLQQANAWHEGLDRQFRAESHQRQYPVHFFHQNRLFQDYLHHLLLTPDEAIIIQHLRYDQNDAKKLGVIAQRKMGGWALLAMQSVKAVLGLPRARCLIHFPLSGQWVELIEQKS
jgi:hypothetical protein